MLLDDVLHFDGRAGATGLFYAVGSFGMVDSANACERTQEAGVTTYRYVCGTVTLTATFTEEANGVYIRRDTFYNSGESPVTVNVLSSRFCLDGADHEVYTQYNSWQSESLGGWQPLVTQVTAASQGIRTCDGAAPMMALHNRQNGRNVVFHLLPNAQWKMTARRAPTNGGHELAVVETGFHNEGLCLTVAAGETVSLPEVIFFVARNRTDLDAWRLHETYNRLYPRKSLPVLYNSWLYCFDSLDIDALLQQADTAAEMGFEAFMIDAGWFGKGDAWWVSVGDWEENTESGPRGRLIELSERVRRHGMTFGLWFEPERACPESVAVKTHPDYYINNRLLDFGNPQAVAHILDVVSACIKKYGVGWVKLDFNDTIPLDPSGNAFYRYQQGQRRFVEGLRERFPHLYITNCAGGGYRMELEQGTMCDSFWFTDNQGPLGGLRILKDTLKRMPACCIERWSAQRYAEGFPRYEAPEPVGVMFSCNNATWEQIVKVDDSFTELFMGTGPLGFSCDIAAFPQAYKEAWKERIARFKADRGFYATATARILTDTDDLTAIQYADPTLRRCVIHLFTKTTRTQHLTVYPVVDPAVCYRAGEEVRSGADLAENGVTFSRLTDNCGYAVELIAE